jgi:hypothetical protein
MTLVYFSVRPRHLDFSDSFPDGATIDTAIGRFMARWQLDAPRRKDLRFFHGSTACPPQSTLSSFNTTRANPLLIYYNGLILPPGTISRESAIKQLSAGGYAPVLCERALDICQSGEFAELLLKLGDVSIAGRDKVNVGPPSLTTFDETNTIRALKYVFDDPAAVARLKEGKTVVLAFPDGARPGYCDFTPTDAHNCLIRLTKKSLNDWNPGDPFFADFEPLVPPLTKRKEATRCSPRFDPRPPPQPLRDDDAFAMDVKQSKGSLMGGMTPEQEAALVEIIRLYECEFEQAAEWAMDADWDLDRVDALWAEKERQAAK